MSSPNLLPFPQGGRGGLGGKGEGPFPPVKARDMDSKERSKALNDKGLLIYVDTGALVNEVWDACIEVLGYEPKTDSEKKLWGRMTTSLRNADADWEKIVAVGEWYHRHWPAIDLTITAIEKWYSHFLRLHEKRKRVQATVQFCDYCGKRDGTHEEDCRRDA